MIAVSVGCLLFLTLQAVESDSTSHRGIASREALELLHHAATATLQP